MKKGVHTEVVLTREGTNPSVMTITKQVLGQAPEEKIFVLKDGKKLRTLYELIDELETMNDDVFKHHVTSLKNDFANWVQEVFNSKPLADALRKLQTPIDHQRTLLKHLVNELKHK
ncbi:MAG: DUF5752 family protein [Nanoarchaeota archaeon]